MGKSLLRTASPPAGSIVQICDEPLRFEMKAIVLPSGDQRGPVSEAFADVSCLRLLPSMETSQRFVETLLASGSHVRRVKATQRPSGEGCGSASLSIATMSCTEKGCGSAEAPAATPTGAKDIRAMAMRGRG